MKIGVYAKFLHTLGGGERVAAVMAEVLAKKGHQVDLISHFEVERQSVENSMGVDLKSVKFVSWFDRSYEKLLIKTKAYDLFINTSYLDHLPSKTKKSIYYVHFPTPIKRNILGFIKYEAVLPYLRRFLIIPEINRGLKPIEEIYVRGGKWLGNSNTIVLSNPPKNFGVRLRIYADRLMIPTLDSVSFDAQPAKIKLKDKYIDHRNSVLTYSLEVDNCNTSSVVLKIKIKSDIEKNAMALVSMTILNLRYIFWNFLKRYLPTYEMALYGSSSYKPAAGLDTYHLFLSNSNFTKKWVKKYWDKESSLLYPPVDVDKFIPGRKKNMIVNVGRFFVGGHSKKQDVLVRAFKEMVDQKLLPDSWELHLVGSVADGKEHLAYLKQLREDSRGYPIFFHISVSFEELKNLYSQAKIYWHATGYGSNERLHPITFEHFGITVVEAMAAGCVPVVYQGGGLVETVRKEDGLTFKTVDHLVKMTADLIDDPKKMRRLSNFYRDRSKMYSRTRFEKEFLEHIKKLTK